MYKNTLYLTVKLAALAAVFMEIFSADTVSGFHAVAVLAFCCLFMTDFLIGRICAGKVVHVICIGAEIAGCFVYGAEMCFPLLLMLIFQLIDKLDAGEYFYWIAAPSALLASFIFTPTHSAAAAAVILSAVGAFARFTSERLENCRETADKQREKISALNEKISGLKAYSKTVREAAALEERNRFSARIHDKLGHGISGSIILLEGAKLNIASNPEQAERCLETAVENLRGSVDSIREALREERPKRSAAEASELKEMLERFSLTYEIGTDFSVSGDIEKVPPQIWSCLKENLTEAMTNTIKHSNAKKFSLSIFIYSMILRAEFADNGSSSGSFAKGIGLEAMEERTASYDGKCIFQSGCTGFKIVNIFRL